MEKLQTFDHMLTPREVGRIGEEVCANYLVGRGCELIERNWRCAMGEVDLIVSDDGQLVLVEVKTRLAPGRRAAMPELAVGREKRERYQFLAGAYLAAHPNIVDLRFDVAGVRIVGEHLASIRYFENVWLGGEA